MEDAPIWLDLARSDLATWLQLTPYAYATVEGFHLVGVAFFFGAIFLLDLRLLGFTPQLVAEPAARFLLRISVPAFVTLAVSGVLLFVPSADRYAASTIFLLKMAAIAAGGLNALAFHLGGKRRTTAVVSIVVWIAVIALGRWLGYERREVPGVELELPLFGAVIGVVTPAIERPILEAVLDDERRHATRAVSPRTRRARPESP